MAHKPIADIEMGKIVIIRGIPARVIANWADDCFVGWRLVSLENLVTGRILEVRMPPYLQIEMAESI